MTFRIDSIARRTAWTASIKGVDGKGVYGRLRTNNAGFGLTLMSAPEHEDRILFSESAFYIPELSTESEASALLSDALKTLGWGPEVDSKFDVIER